MKHISIYLTSFVIIFILNNCGDVKPHLKEPPKDSVIDKAITLRLEYIERYMREHYGS